jgi:hypothetical protein
VQYTPVTYGSDYQYPKWAEILGICISLSSMLWIPLYIVYYILTTPGTLREVSPTKIPSFILYCCLKMPNNPLGFNQGSHTGFQDSN